MAEEKMKSVLVVDDTPTNIDILLGILAENYYVSIFRGEHNATIESKRKKRSNHPLVIVNQGIPMSIITSDDLRDQIQRDLSRAAYFDQELSALLLKDVLVVDSQWPIAEVSDQYLKRSKNELFDPIIVTKDQKFVGLIPAYHLIKQIVE